MVDKILDCTTRRDIYNGFESAVCNRVFLSRMQIALKQRVTPPREVETCTTQFEMSIDTPRTITARLKNRSSPPSTTSSSTALAESRARLVLDARVRCQVKRRPSLEDGTVPFYMNSFIKTSRAIGGRSALLEKRAL